MSFLKLQDILNYIMYHGHWIGAQKILNSIATEAPRILHERYLLCPGIFLKIKCLIISWHLSIPTFSTLKKVS